MIARLCICAVYRRGVVALSISSRVCLVVRVPCAGAALRDRVSTSASESSKVAAKALARVWRDRALRQRLNGFDARMLALLLGVSRRKGLQAECTSGSSCLLLVS